MGLGAVQKEGGVAVECFPLELGALLLFIGFVAGMVELLCLGGRNGAGMGDGRKFG